MTPHAGPTPRAGKKAASRQKILDAAREVFFRDGFMDANLDDVALGAGLAKGTLYRYFESKAELYVAVLSENGEAFVARLREALAGRRDGPDRIRSLAYFYRDHWRQNPEYFQIFWAVENQPVIGELPRAVVEEVTRLWRSCLQELAGAIEAGVESGDFRSCDPWLMANLLWSSANALIRSEEVPARRELRRTSLDDSFEAMLELFLCGLRRNA
jgi:AcrR family transcriptional regulator